MTTLEHAGEEEKEQVQFNTDDIAFPMKRPVTQPYKMPRQIEKERRTVAVIGARLEKTKVE